MVIIGQYLGLLLASLLLLACGDVESNPGPDTERDSNGRYISFCHANMRSIRKCPDKIEHIKAELCGRYDIITISETWLSPDDNLDRYGKPMYMLDSYHMPIRRDRSGRRGGGVLAWVSERLLCKRRPDLESPDIELMWLEIRHKNNTFIMGVAYRPNDHIQFWDSLQASYNEVLAAGYDNIIITGDLNADPSTPDGRKLLYFIDLNNLTKHVKEPTRITDRSSSELDQIVSNCDYLIQDVMVSPPVSYNDHNTVSATIKFHIRHAKAFQRIMWQYDMTNFDGFRQKLSALNWEHCFTSNDVDTAAQAWTDMLMNAARECIPNKLVTVRPRDKPFFNGYLRRLRRSKERAHKRAKYDNTPEAWLAFRNQRGFYFSEIKRLKNEHTNHIQQTMTESLVSNPRKWWSLSKRLLNDKAPSIPALDVNGTAVCDDTEKAQVFNEYFIQCSTLDTSTAQLQSNYPSLTESHIGSWQTSVNDVVNCLSKIDTSKAVGPDGINPKLLKEGAHQLAPSLCKLYNLSLDLGKVPKIWKYRQM